MSGAYYNEIDPYAAQWLRNLIAAGHIAPGDVDERSIADVSPVDLIGYRQCHFFAGIGVWSHALRAAGWPDERPVWTGSCPCQPFSAAGKGEGTDDARHLWPEWFRLIREHRPVAVFGEQVSAAIRHGWLDLVSADLEGAGYAVGSAVLGAHSVGAPHIRQRLYFVAESTDQRHERAGAARNGGYGSAYLGAACELAGAEGSDRGLLLQLGQPRVDHLESVGRGKAGGPLEHASSDGREQRGAESSGRRAAGGCGSSGAVEHPAGEQVGIPGRARQSGGAGVALGDTEQQGLERLAGHGDHRDEPGRLGADQARPVTAAGRPSFWSACDWLPCIDGKARPVEPGTFPLASRIAGRVGRLRAYGNAINAEAAAAFVRAYREGA